VATSIIITTAGILDMEFLIGGGLALFLLWAWLRGHWFARVVMFLLLATIGLGLGGLLGSGSHDESAQAVFALLGAALAWPLASIPIYY
jgi:hypothetical protein